MACTTILVGKDASYDGSTIIARNEDSANGEFNPKRFIVVKPEEQPREYKSVISPPDHHPAGRPAAVHRRAERGPQGRYLGRGRRQRGERGDERHRNPDHQRARARRRPVRGIHAGQGR